mmetsp:Transcript_13192/g.36409  ORF Transcript_13192/g.36409 Transcript_13192/m.36409 type:complete len:95 (-) Transcript_13192:186-470(-)|eukprot:CAMPEP_0179136296 /NCGR_PEP_ID=MMETSP0796-20121207/64941_1 /TAXON_ID=73915 /ORGANISM="Pyrodinium bahamense, Strain pbaha01" /LENGTH=94 /DNA_ID=CAMNT_0020835371 /DNA_START=16 /DNA_END=300 /DNA_ORIENTATION=-
MARIIAIVLVVALNMLKCLAEPPEPHLWQLDDLQRLNIRGMAKLYCRLLKDPTACRCYDYGDPFIPDERAGVLVQGYCHEFFEEIGDSSAHAEF